MRKLGIIDRAQVDALVGDVEFSLPSDEPRDD